MHVGIFHGALGKDLHEWRPAQVSDYARLKGSGRYAPGQTQDSALADMERVLAELKARHPGIKTHISAANQADRISMPAFEVLLDSPIVKALNEAFTLVRGEQQPTGPIPPSGFYGTDAAHLYQEGGMQGVVCGPGGRYNTMPDERVDIQDYLDMIRIYISTILTICEVDESAS